MSDLPPLELAQAYVVVGPNDQRGPYTLELLISEVIAQRLSEATPVWWPGLADWTTMGGHPGVSAELQRRRAPAAAPDPGWTVPSQAPPPAAAAAPAAQAAAPVADPTQPVDTFSPFAPSAPVVDPEPLAAPEPVASSYEPESPAAEVTVMGGSAPATEDAVDAVDDVVDAEIIEVASVTTVDGQHLQIYAALVARSATRAERQRELDEVEEAIIAAVTAGVATQGFELAERTDVERAHELRFDGNDSDLVVVSLGRPNATRPEDLRDDHVPITVSYRSSSDITGHHAGTGEHGEVVVAADEWTGQATSSVSLFLGLEEYLTHGLQVDEAAVSRDVAAAVAIVRAKLG